MKLRFGRWLLRSSRILTEIGFCWIEYWNNPPQYRNNRQRNDPSSFNNNCNISNRPQRTSTGKPICNFCHKPGHVERTCYKKHPNIAPQNPPPSSFMGNQNHNRPPWQFPPNAYSNPMRNSTPKVSFKEGGNLNMFSQKSQKVKQPPALVLTAYYKQYGMKFLVDTGACLSFMNLKVFELFPSLKRK